MKPLTVIIAALSVLMALPTAGEAARRERNRQPAPPVLSQPKGSIDTLFIDRFETDTMGWSTTDLLVQTPYFHIDSYNAYSGNSWWCGTYDPSFTTNPGYGDAWVQFLYPPAIDLSTIASDSVVLSFMHYYNIEGPSGGSDWDCVNLWASTDSGATWAVLYPDESRGTPPYNLSNATGWHYCGLAPIDVHVPGWGGSNGGWSQAWFDLSPFKGGPVALRFAVVSDGAESDQNSSYNGAWYLDSIRVDTVSAGGGAEAIFYDDVESGTNGWTTGVKTPAIHWHRTANRANSPVISWYCGDSLTHLQSWGYSDALVSPVIDLREVKPTFPCLAQFTQWVDLRDGNNGYVRGWDYYDIDASADTGRTWTALAQYDPATTQSAWTAGPSVSLSPYVGGTVMLRIAMNTDEDDTTGEGVYIDDLIITGKGLDPLPGPATVLLMDNDANAVDLSDNSWTKYFEASLAGLGYRYSAAGIGVNKQMQPGYLDQFPAVIWNLGASYTPIAAGDIECLMSYLANGGRLWLSGQYYFSINPDTTVHPNLWTDYLHLAPDNGWYPSTAVMVTGVSGDPISDGFAETLNYDYLNGGYVYWTDPWHAYALNPDTPAVAGITGFYRNDDSTLCGLRFWDGSPGGYRLAYTAFPFEAISGSDQRDTAAARILAWLLPGTPDNQAPATPQGFTAVQEYDSVVCRWSANTEPDLAGYRVYRSLQQGLPEWRLIGVALAPDTSLADTLIAPNAIYHYAAAAFDSAQPVNQSAWTPWRFLRAVSWVKQGMAGGLATGIPREYGLGQCRPNPVSDRCQIEFALPEPGAVRLDVYNVAGQRVRTIIDRALSAGYHRVQWDGTGENGDRAANGVYLYRLAAARPAGPAFTQTKRLLLVK